MGRTEKRKGTKGLHYLLHRLRAWRTEWPWNEACAIIYWHGSWVLKKDAAGWQMRDRRQQQLVGVVSGHWICCINTSRSHTTCSFNKQSLLQLTVTSLLIISLQKEGTLSIWSPPHPSHVNTAAAAVQ